MVRIDSKNPMNLEFIDIPKIKNPKGNIAVLEGAVVPFEIRRVYYLFDVPSGARRGGHAHKNLMQILIAVSGSFDVILKDGRTTHKVTLNRPDRGLLIRNNIWREMESFSAGAVGLVLASDVYEESDYIRTFKEYLAHVK